jgi:Sec-independent protein translocase protein TatA
MMYGNSYNPTASAAKAIVVFLSLILIGTVALVLLASGNLGPKAEAQAKQIESQTRLEEAERRFELEKKAADYKRQQEQAARDFELTQALKDWGTRATLIGLILVATIFATGKSAQWIRSSSVVAQPQPTAQPAPSADATRLRNVYALLEQMNNRMETMQHQLANTQAQLMATQHQLEQLQVHGNGSDPNTKILPFTKSATG